MGIIPFEPDQDFLYFLSRNMGADPATIRPLFSRLDSLFSLHTYDAYRQALFVSYLVYVLGDERRLEIVSSRLEAVVQDDYVPLDKDHFLEIWLGVQGAAQEGLSPDFPTFFKQTLAPILERLQQFLAEKGRTFVDLLKQAFDQFFAQVEEELFLSEMEIHSDELHDSELEGEAVRWEYKYLGNEHDKILERRRIYLERQSEWLKSN